MDVTRSNFKQVLEDLESVIRESQYLAIDGEFTGLSSGPGTSPFDTPREYYAKLRDGSLNFLFIQFGLCAFKYNSKEDKWTHRAYNFYTFPKPFRRNADTRFMCQSSSMDFLSANGFDFNKLFRDGIPYLSMADEAKEREFLEEKHSKEKAHKGSTPGRDSNIIPIPDDLVDFVNDFCVRVDKFVASDDKECEVNAGNAFRRKLLYQATEERYAKQVTLETRNAADGNRVLVVMRIASEEEREQREEERRQQELQELDDAVGFSKVIRLMSASDKLVVGHNMLLDVCHVLDKFCGRLPASYADFKDMARAAFPRVVDTKYMSQYGELRELIRSNVLSDLRTTLSGEPFNMPTVGEEAEGAGYKADTVKYHEAGYDAYVTGLCFLTMARYLDAKSLHPSVESLPLLKPIINKILIVRIQDCVYINLTGNDPEPPRDHVFHITFPREWKTYDVVNVFKPIGAVFVSWLSDTTAYVSLHEREKASCVVKRVPRSSDYSVVSYARHKQLLAAPQSPACSGVKRKRNSLPGRESKLTRRSIDTIVEEDAVVESPAKGTDLVIAALAALLPVLVLYLLPSPAQHPVLPIHVPIVATSLTATLAASLTHTLHSNTVYLTLTALMVLWLGLILGEVT